MICHRIGCEPTGIIGLGMFSEYSRMRIPRPPQKSTTFIWNTREFSTILWIKWAMKPPNWRHIIPASELAAKVPYAALCEGPTSFDALPVRLTSGYETCLLGCVPADILK